MDHPSVAAHRPYRTEARDAAPAAWRGRIVQVRWPSVRFGAPGRDEGGSGGGAAKAGRVEFVLSVEPLDREHAMLEAWIESAGGARQAVFERKPVKAQIAADGAILHIDAWSGDPESGERLAAISIRTDPSDSVPRRPTFAQTCLMRAAGFRAGTYDPPVLHRADAQPDAASA